MNVWYRETSSQLKTIFFVSRVLSSTVKQGAHEIEHKDRKLSGVLVWGLCNLPELYESVDEADRLRLR